MDSSKRLNYGLEAPAAADRPGLRLLSFSIVVLAVLIFLAVAI